MVQVKAMYVEDALGLDPQHGIEHLLLPGRAERKQYEYALHPERSRRQLRIDVPVKARTAYISPETMLGNESDFEKSCRSVLQSTPTHPEAWCECFADSGVP